MTKTEFKVTGMTCQGCASSVKRVLLRHKSIDDVDIDQMEGKVVVSYDEKTLETSTIIELIERLSFKAKVNS